MAEMLAEPQSETDRCQLPADWDLARLGDIASLASGGTPSKNRPDFWEGPIPWASPKDLKQPFLLDTEDHISEAGLEDGSRLVERGTLFVVVRGMILARDLPVAMAMVPMAFNQDMKAMVPGPRVDGRFLLYAFQQWKGKLLPEIGTSAHGTRRISTSAVENFTIPLPPLFEQKAIALALDAVRRAKEATEKTIAAARQFKDSLMRHLFTYGPVPVEQADQVRTAEKEIGPLPEGWRVEELGNAIRATQYGLSQRGESSGGYPILRMNNLQEGRLVTSDVQYVDLDDAEHLKYKLNPGDLLFNRTNSFDLVGKTSLFEGDGDYVFASYLIRVVPDPSRLDSEFINYYMNADSTQARLKLLATRAVSQSNINATKLRGLHIPLPSLDEQREIAAALRAVDQKISAEEARRQALSSLFSSLLHNLMTGKLRVRDLPLPTSTEAAP
jgi:type I restriction enzyme S subunit